jgi:hypothetical protein
MPATTQGRGRKPNAVCILLSARLGIARSFEDRLCAPPSRSLEAKYPRGGAG